MSEMKCPMMGTAACPVTPDEKETKPVIKSPVILDKTGIRIAEALEGKLKQHDNVTSLDRTALATGNIVEAAGIPVYVKTETLELYSDFGITETGWYVFARIAAKEGVIVSTDTTVTGAAGFITDVGANHVDVAVKFEVAATSKIVKIIWNAENIEVFVFRATDLAIRNLDYRVTFYVYDSEDKDRNFVTWEYDLTPDTSFVGTQYYIESEGVYTRAAVKANEAIPADTYYTHSYALTADETFAEGKTYYTKSDTNYTAAEVTAGDAVTADTYYEDKFELAKDVAFVGNAYYTVEGDVYTQAAVVAGEEIPADTYYKHSKVIFEGMTRNVTYVCNTVIDCPMQFILPAVEDETHGCWFEIRCKHAGAYSMTLTPPSADVKIATEHTQKETAGINMINLHYTKVGSTKLWRFMNTHSSIPA